MLQYPKYREENRETEICLLSINVKDEKHLCVLQGQAHRASGWVILSLELIHESQTLQIPSKLFQTIDVFAFCSSSFTALLWGPS